MATDLTTHQTRYVATGSVEDIALDCQGLLRGSATVSSATVSQSTGSGFSLSAVSVNTERLEINDRWCEPGEAITFRLTVGAATGACVIKALCTLSTGEVKPVFMPVTVSTS